jgi:hypothetical protein
MKSSTSRITYHVSASSRKETIVERAGNGHGGGGSSEDGASVSLRVSAEQSCTLLFLKLPTLDDLEFEARLEQRVGPCYADVTRMSASTLVAGTVTFENHRIVLLGMPMPASKEAMDRTVEVAPMPPERRAEMRAHHATVRLLYVGDSSDPLDQLGALHRIAAVLLSMDGNLGLLNERAALALPTDLARQYIDQLEVGVPAIQLWVGALTFPVGEKDQEPDRYIVRTYGMSQMRLPDLAMTIPRLEEADNAYHVLLNVCLYMAEDVAGEELGAGDRIDFSGRTYLLAEPHREMAATGGRLLSVVQI